MKNSDWGAAKVVLHNTNCIHVNAISDVISVLSVLKEIHCLSVITLSKTQGQADFA